MTVTARFVAAVGLMLACMPLAVHAEQSQTFGDYAIHYSALATGDLTPDIARAYGITRSKNRALLNVAVLKKTLGTATQPVTATVRVTATNLSNQMQTLDPREVREGTAIYYLTEFGITDQEIIDFSIEVIPERGTQATTVKFRQQFFTH